MFVLPNITNSLTIFFNIELINVVELFIIYVLCYSRHYADSLLIKVVIIPYMLHFRSMYVQSFHNHILLLQDLMVGDEASKLRSMLEISYPMQNGIVRYV